MKTSPSKHLKLLATLVAGLASGAASYAADVTFGFDTDPRLDPGFMIAGNHYAAAWTNIDGNPATGGFLSIADGSTGDANLCVVFPDIDAGLPVKAFHLTCDVRVGNGTIRPADGFSISYAREGDIVLQNITNLNGTTSRMSGAAGGDDAATTTSPSGSGDLENGTKSGVAIIFDAWQGNQLPDTGAGKTPGPDVEGIAVRVDDKTLVQVDMTAGRNGGCFAPTNSGCNAAVCGDQNSMQTGAYANDGGDYHNLCWATLDVTLTVDKHVTVIWKGRTIINDYVLPNYPNHRGRLVLMGRTGGSNQSAHFDNIHLVTVPANESTFDFVRFGPNLNQFNLQISDNGGSHTTNINMLILDGVDVTSTMTQTKVGTITYATNTQPAFFASGTTHTISVGWRTDLNQSLTASNFTFVVSPYLILPGSLAVPASSIDLTTAGFFAQPYQIATGTPNRNYYADETLFGIHGTNWVDVAAMFNGTNGNEVASTFPVDYANVGSEGQFQVNNAWSFLGIPGPANQPNQLLNEDNSAVAFMAYLNFTTPGLYTLGINSDDGVRVSFSKNSHEVLGLTAPGVGFDGGRGIGLNQNIGSVYVTNAGYYGVRVLFYNGGGGSGVEFYSKGTPATTASALVGDSSDPNSIQAFRISSAGGPYVKAAEPPMDDDNVYPTTDAFYDLADNGGATVTAGSIVLTINGVVRSPVITTASGVTHVALAHPSSFWPVGTNTVSLVFNDSASVTHTYNYNFIVAPYVTLPTNLTTAPGSGSVPGFSMNIFQTANTNIFNGWQNNSRMAIEAMNGLYPPNIAGQTSTILWPGVINFSQNDNGTIANNGNFQTNATTGGGWPDAALPGIPVGAGGVANNDAFRATAFVEFPTAGFYIMGVNSDDGFRVTLGDRTSPGKSMLEVITPASIAGEVVGMSTTQTDRDGNRGFGGALPTTPIIAQAVLCDPLDASTALNNASAIAGKIAVCMRGPGFNVQSRNALNAGAIAVVGGLLPADAGMLPGTRGGTDAGITIPCVQVTYETGTNLYAHATTNSSSPLWLRVSAEDCSLELGNYNGGRGSSDTTFGVNVAQAGLYPLSLVWENAGGGQNCEWFVQDAVTGVKTLINDPAGPVKAWTVRTVPSGARLNQPSVSGSNVNLSWTGKGELEYAYSVTGPWRKAANQSNPQSVSANPAITGTFYRIRSF